MGKKTRVNITVDKELLDKAKTKLGHFGGKVSTLFNAFLTDFVNTIGKDISRGHSLLERRMSEFEQRLKKFEDKHKK